MTTVQFVFCMDTEGPCADPSRTDLLPTWQSVDAAMDKLFDASFRSRWPDSDGNGLRIGWFFLTWTGFTTNPRQRALGYHAVRDHYLARWQPALTAFGDEQCWHYHHPSASGVGNEWGLDWTANSEYAQILSRQILERGWFPVCFRAGGTILNAVSSRWVDQWFPYDFSNRAPLKIDGLVDWSAGVRQWVVYHPSPERFDQPGAGRRKMARCLDLETNVHSLTDREIEAAFEQAQRGMPALVSCFDHDYRDIADRIDRLRERISIVAARYPGVRWRYAAPVEGVRGLLGASDSTSLSLEAFVGKDHVTVWSNKPIYQSVPWLALRSADGSVHHVEQDLVRIDERRWRWNGSASFDWVDGSFAASSDDGSSSTVAFHRADRGPRGFLDQPARRHALQPRSIWEHSKNYAASCVRRAAGEGPEMDSVRQTRELLLPRVSKGMRVLDAGCGAGHAWHGLKELGIEYYGVDSYARGIEVGRELLEASGLPSGRLRTMAIEDLPPDERYDVVVCLNTLLYVPMYHRALEALASATDRWLVIRSSFGDETEVRYLPDILLEDGFQDMHAWFNIFGRSEVEILLRAQGFDVEWIEDDRQRSRFRGAPETVGGIPLPYTFLLATRVRPRPTAEERLGDFGAAAKAWRDKREGGPSQ